MSAPETPRAIGFVVVGAEAWASFDTLASLLEQSAPPVRVWHVSKDDLHEALEDIDTDWVVVVRAGSQFDPLWLSRAQRHVELDSLGVVGGRLLEFEGARTAARWMAGTPRHRLGRCSRDPEVEPSEPSRTSDRGACAFLELGQRHVPTGSAS